MTKLTEAEMIARYDATRLSPVAPELPSHLLALRAQIDAETDPETRQLLILRLADQVLADYEATVSATPAAASRCRAGDDQIERAIAVACDQAIADHRAADDSFGVDENIDEIIAALEAIEAAESHRTALRSAVTDPVTVTHQDGWDEYVAGDTEITVIHQDGVIGDRGPIDLYIRRQQLDERITYELLTRLMCDLGHLLSDDRVLAALGQPPMSAL